MFWSEEDIQPVINLAEKLFGSGDTIQYYNRNAIPNISLMTREFGKLWVGDLEINETTKENMEKLSATINQRIYFCRDFNIEDAMYVTVSKLRDIGPEEMSYR